jgi:YVTN family beta-propeller protein
LKKMIGKQVFALLAAISLAGTVQAASASRDPQFALTQKYSLSGAEKWDYLGIDPVRHHLFISRASHVQVVDTGTGKQIGDIPDTDGVHGFAFAQDRQLGFATNGRADTVTVFDLTTLKTVATIKAGGRDPDAIIYSAKLARIYVSNGDSNSVSAIDIDSRKVIATMDIGGKPESLATDNTGMVFVAVEDKNEIVAMDGKTNRVTAHWPLAGLFQPAHGGG